jgi:hypothetical protein
MPSLIRRHLKACDRFTQPGEGKSLPSSLAAPEGEALVGWYSNPPPWEDDWLLFTDQAIHAYTRTEHVRIAWQNIIDYKTPSSKTNVNGVTLRTKDFERFIRVAGSHGANHEYRDAFSLTMLLNTLVNHHRRRS